MAGPEEFDGPTAGRHYLGSGVGVPIGIGFVQVFGDSRFGFKRGDLRVSRDGWVLPVRDTRGSHHLPLLGPAWRLNSILLYAFGDEGNPWAWVAGLGYSYQKPLFFFQNHGGDSYTAHTGGEAAHAVILQAQYDRFGVRIERVFYPGSIGDSTLAGFFLTWEFGK